MAFQDRSVRVCESGHVVTVTAAMPSGTGPGVVWCPVVRQLAGITTPQTHWATLQITEIRWRIGGPRNSPPLLLCWGSCLKARECGDPTLSPVMLFPDWRPFHPARPLENSFPHPISTQACLAVRHRQLNSTTERVLNPATELQNQMNESPE